jgi:signal-transduction protein with cAMP-binding, CBS, and nucleotidyltransferase domain
MLVDSLTEIELDEIAKRMEIRFFKTGEELKDAEKEVKKLTTFKLIKKDE